MRALGLRAVPATPRSPVRSLAITNLPVPRARRLPSFFKDRSNPIQRHQHMLVNPLPLEHVRPLGAPRSSADLRLLAQTLFRQANGHDGAFARLALDLDRAVMQFDQSFR